MVGNGAPEELELDEHLLQENKAKVRTKRGVFNNKKNKKTTHRRMTRATSSSSSTSLSNKPTTAPSKKGEKYSVKGTNKQQKDKTY